MVIFGLLLVVVGVVLTALGAKLVGLDGSPYYLIIGLAWLVSGLLLILRKNAGLYLYTISFIVTVIWALWESGLNGWALVPRLDFALVFMIIAAILMPGKALQSSARRYGLGLVVVVIVGLAIAVPLANKPYAVVASSTPAGQYYDDAITPANQDWDTYGGGNGGQRFSTLAQITPANVDQLKRVWVYRTGDAHMANYGSEDTPLKIGNSLYVCTVHHAVFALDAATGQKKWSFDPQTPAKASTPNSACRGVAYYADPQATPGTECSTRIIAGTLDEKLFAVDAQTGKLCESFGDHGYVDLMQGLGKWPAGLISITSAPTIVRGVIVTSQQVSDGMLREAASGVVRGFDAVTGKLNFAWDLGRPETTTTPPDGQTYTKGTPNAWSTFVADDKLGLVYLPMASSSGDYLSSTRTPEERKYDSSVVALDVTTGKPRWVYQIVKNDVWDYDTPAQPVLVDFPTDHGNVPALIQTTKQGDIWVLNRLTGQPLTQVENQPVPQDGVEPSERAATQARPVYARLQQPDLTEHMMWGISPIDQAVCRIQFRQANYQGIFTPPSADKPWIEYPGNNGGSDWGSLSIDVHHGIIISNYNNIASYDKLVPRAIDDAMGVFWPGDPRYKHAPPGRNRPQAGLAYGQDVNTGWVSNIGVICTQPPFGMIRAIDMGTGKTLWDRPLGTAQRNGPWGIPSMMPFTIGLPNNGGTLTTDSGVAFVGATTDDFFRAIDVKTGKTLWRDQMPAGVQATPMTYSVDGRQYLVIVATGHHGMGTPEGDYVIAYALPQAKS